MKKIEELRDTGEDPDVDNLREKLNEVIQVVNSLKCVEEERPVLEGLCEGECFLISIDDDGLLTACNHNGEVVLKKVREGNDVNHGKMPNPGQGVEVG